MPYFDTASPNEKIAAQARNDTLSRNDVTLRPDIASHFLEDVFAFVAPNVVPRIEV